MVWYKYPLLRGLFKIYFFCKALIANVYFGFPARHLICIGVTGTDGKTTTVHMIERILSLAGKSCGVLSTIDFKVGETWSVNESKMTTLGAWDLQQKLAAMVKAGNTHVVVETSSHALDQFRVWGILYDIAVVTNVAWEHIDYHLSMERYAQAKKRLVQNVCGHHTHPELTNTVILNAEDAIVHGFKKDVTCRVWEFGFKEGELTASDVVLQADSTSFVLHTPQGTIPLSLALMGSFNVSNALAASGVALALGISLEDIQKGLQALKPVPGRMQSIKAGQDFTVLIDYAVTPQAFEKLYSTVDLLPHNRLIAVFGACGDRDQQKRPVLGKIAYEKCDYLILTNEDNWSEKPEDIIAMIEKGVMEAGGKRGVDYEVVVDRKEAIARALSLAKAQDLVVVSGKGCETGMAVGPHEVIPWSDQEIIETLLKRL